MHAGAPLWKSLAAGEWTLGSLAAWRRCAYDNLHQLDNESVVQAQVENEFVEIDG